MIIFLLLPTGIYHHKFCSSLNLKKFKSLHLKFLENFLPCRGVAWGIFKATFPEWAENSQSLHKTCHTSSLSFRGLESKAESALHFSRVGKKQILLQILTNLKKFFQLFAVIKSRDVGRKLQEIFSTLPSFFNHSFIKSPWNRHVDWQFQK